MKQVLIKISTAMLAFAVGVAATAIWSLRRPEAVPNPSPPMNCAIPFDPTLLTRTIHENDDPELFKAFQEMPLYVMPSCVDEAYSLTWIPSFHSPVFVRIWRVGDQAFMVGKSLDSKGWSKFESIRESNARALTRFEWRDFTDVVNRTDYWQLPETTDEAIPQDGAVWLIDGLKSKQYHWVGRRVPNDQFADLARHLIRLSGLETAHDLYLPSTSANQ